MVEYLTLERTVAHPEDLKGENHITQKYQDLNYLDRNF